jgi:hypothetical protein
MTSGFLVASCAVNGNQLTVLAPGDISERVVNRGVTKRLHSSATAMVLVTVTAANKLCWLVSASKTVAAGVNAGGAPRTCQAAGRTTSTARSVLMA